MAKPTTYPSTPDATIAVGDRVRSFDFVGNPGCYFVGVVEGVSKFDGFSVYNIKVDYQVWEGKRAETNYCASVHPPINGMQGIFGLTCGVQRILEGEETCQL